MAMLWYIPLKQRTGVLSLGSFCRVRAIVCVCVCAIESIPHTKQDKNTFRKLIILSQYATKLYYLMEVAYTIGFGGWSSSKILHVGEMELL